MKIALMVIIVVLIGVIAYLSIKGRDVTVIRTEIDIAASPSIVWGVLTDVNKWAEWSPIISASSGTVGVGEKLSITMVGKEAGKDGPKYSPTIQELNEPTFFRWRAHMVAGFVFTNDKIFELEQTDIGTKLIHKETFQGLLAPVFCGQMEKGIPPMLNAMNKALKEVAER